MTNQEKNHLEQVACRVRMGIIEGTCCAKSGHPGGSLSAADVFAYLYEKELRVDPGDPQKPDRDRFVLSKGHCAPGLYAALALRGFFPWEELKSLRHVGSMLQGHPNMRQTPGVDMSTGSLGQGVSTACGMALAARKKGMDVNVYTLLGDGEVDEGQVWEAFMFAAHYRLANLCVMIDLNGLQIDGANRDVMNIEPLDAKLEAFGFRVLSIDGHDFGQMEQAFAAFHAEQEKPTALLLRTTKGKGVSYMENAVGWHGKAPNQAEYEQAMQELSDRLAALEKEVV